MPIHNLIEEPGLGQPVDLGMDLNFQIYQHRPVLAGHTTTYL
jgi:hypothetical protein